jgi:beta-lactamase class D
VLQLLPDDPVDQAAADEPAVPALTATDVATRFLDAFTAGDAEGAAALTDDAVGARTTISQVWQGLTPTSVVAGRDRIVEAADGKKSVVEPFGVTWDFGAGRTWTYDSALTVVETDAGWQVRWLPAIVHPKLVAGHGLALRDQVGQPAVVDRDGAPLMTWAEDGATAVEPRVAPLLLPGMGRVAKGQSTTGGWQVVLVDKAGKDLEALHGTQPKPFVSTVSRPVQQAAQAAVDAQRLPTMIVAIQPSTGELLAVAQNSAASSEPVALNGLYPPGSTFKIATATALIEAGVADVDTVLPCPKTASIGSRTVDNADFGLGDVPLRTAFAESCNTTFATAAADLSLDALPSAADQLGLGADFDIPGIVTEAGAVPAAGSTTEQVENSIGQGTVQASCFGMAMVTATVASGQAVTPKLWRGLETTVNAGYHAPPAPVIGSLRTMMRAVVTEGRGSALAGHGSVFGKTGTAQTGRDSAHGWFTGYRDDVAFATLVLDSGTSSTAVTVSGAFLGAFG